MNYKDDFVNEDDIVLEVEGRQFGYKPTTGGDENDWLKDIMKVGHDKKPVIDWGEYNKKKLMNITSVPYPAEVIKSVTHVENGNWGSLSAEQRYELLSKLKPGLFDKLVNAIKKADEPDVESAKN